MPNLIAEEKIEKKIFFIRGKKVMLDKDLAELYGVKTKALNQAVKRNIERFPEDFMLKLSREEAYSLRSQIVTLKQGQHIKHLPYAFTEQGVAMLSSILKSNKAIMVNIQIMRAFTRLKRLTSTHKELANKLNELETKVTKHDREIQSIFNAIHKLIEPQVNKSIRRIGFQVN